jgi:hypothetical protein
VWTGKKRLEDPLFQLFSPFLQWVHKRISLRAICAFTKGKLPMDYTSSAIADREARWFTSCNFKSAQVIESIRESGITQGEITMILKSSPILFSHLCRAFGGLIKGRVYS